MVHALNWRMPEATLLRQIFSPPVTHLIMTTKVYKEERSFYWVVKQAVGEVASADLDTISPTSTEHFLATVSPLLSQAASKQITQNLTYFNQMCEENVADTYLGEKTMGEWLSYFVETVFMAAQTQAEPPTSVNSSATYSSTGKSTAPSTPPLTHNKSERPILGYDGADEPTTKPKITQVTLRGASILSAWKENDTVVDHRYNATLRKLVDIFSLAKNDKPDQAGGPTVFHGTAAHFKGPSQNWPNFWENATVDLAPASSGCQMNPPGVNVVYTAFSPLRAFLWAAFQGTMYQNIPNRENLNFMNQSWTSQGRAFKGVAMFAFDVTTPAPQSLIWAMIPERDGPAFSSRVEELRRGGSGKAPDWNPDDAWVRLRETAGSNSDTWPQVLHSREFGQQQRDLANFRCNLWRSCWLEGKGLDVLNNSYKFTVAIEFIHVPRPAAPPKAAITIAKESKKDDKEDGKGGWKGLKHKFSKLSLSKGKKSAGQA